LRIFFAVIKSILKKISQLLVVILGVLNVSRPLLVVVPSDCLVQEAGLFLGLGLRLLHVFLLQIGVLLIHAILAELRPHVCHTNIDVCVKMLWLLDQAVH